MTAATTRRDNCNYIIYYYLSVQLFSRDKRVLLWICEKYVGNISSRKEILGIFETVRSDLREELREKIRRSLSFVILGAANYRYYFVLIGEYRSASLVASDNQSFVEMKRIAVAIKRGI